MRWKALRWVNAVVYYVHYLKKMDIDIHYVYPTTDLVELMYQRNQDFAVRNPAVVW